jgi:hypothetical protein
MSDPIFHPRFSVRAAFNDGIADASDPQYATAKGRAYANSVKKCTNNEQKSMEVKAMDATNRAPNKNDRQYWESLSGRRTQRNYQPMVQGDLPYDPSKFWNYKNNPNSQLPDGQTLPDNKPVARADAATNRKWMEKAGQRAVQGQKEQRQNAHKDNVTGLRPNIYRVNLPSQVLTQGEFTLEIPEGVNAQSFEVSVPAEAYHNGEFTLDIPVRADGQPFDMATGQNDEEGNENPVLEAIIYRGNVSSGRIGNLTVPTNDNARILNSVTPATDKFGADARKYWGGRTVVNKGASRFTAKNQ